MTLDLTALRRWSAERLLEEYEQRRRERAQATHLLLADMYDHWDDEMRLIERRCRAQWDCEPDQLRDRGIIAATWTDEHGVAHEWRGKYHCVGVARLDRPARPVTYVVCLARYSGAYL